MQNWASIEPQFISGLLFFHLGTFKDIGNMPDVNCFSWFWEWYHHWISYTEAVLSKGCLSLCSKTGLPELGEFFWCHFLLWLTSVYLWLFWFSCWAVDEYSSVSPIRSLAFSSICHFALKQRAEMSLQGLQTLYVATAEWSSEILPKELPCCALSVSFSSVSPASVPATLVLFHLLSYFCRQRHWPSWEKNVRIPWDPLVFQVCLALADKWLNTLSSAAAKSLQSCPTLCDPIGGSPPGSPVPGILQARTLECCHFLLQCMKVKSESEVAQSCPTLRDPMDCSPPGSSFHGIFQARVLEWGAIAFSEYSFWGSSKSCISFLFQTSPLYRGKVLLVLILPSVCALCN